MAAVQPSENPDSEPGAPEEEEAAGPPPPSYPPYAPYSSKPAPPSLADTIVRGRDLRRAHKNVARKPVHPPPRPAKPKRPKVTDVKLSKRKFRAHARCLRRHGAVLTERLEHMAKPARRRVIALWRENAQMLPAETIARLRGFLDADEPFKPDQAYEYFINLRKTKRKDKAMRRSQAQADMKALCGDQRLLWARNATIAFARGLQQRLSRPARYTLADGMLRLSNIILDEICTCVRMRAPSRCSAQPRARFLMDIADKVAVWIDEILSESDDRMLMMDFDEDDEVEQSYGDEDGSRPASPATSASRTSGETTASADSKGGILKEPQAAYLKFSGDMLEAFNILTNAMKAKGAQELVKHGKFSQTFAEGAEELKKAPDFEATDYNLSVANQLLNDLAETAKPTTPPNIEPAMKEMVDICSKYLAQHAEMNKDKGPAFKLLVKNMKTKAGQQLFEKGKVKRTYGKAAKQLEDARGLESDHDDPNLSQDIHATIKKLTDPVTPSDLKTDMAETLDICSKYLSQGAVDEIERGPAFDLLVKELEKEGAEGFTPQYPSLNTKRDAAYTLQSAPGFSSSVPDAATAPTFNAALHSAVDASTPENLKTDMRDVIDRCAGYLSAFVRDRDPALQILLKTLKANPKKELVKRENYAMDYGTAATETETAPNLVPFLPIKDIADEVKKNLTTEMEKPTPSPLKVAMKSLVQDVARHLSQPVAVKSGVAGERYPLGLLAAIKRSLGRRPLFKYKAFGQTYKDAGEELKVAGPLQSDPKSEPLKHTIFSEMQRGVPIRVSPTMANNLDVTMDKAAGHLAKSGMEKGEALNYMVGLMKERGDAPLANLQGRQQTYKEGATRIENTPSLASENVDKGAYEGVKGNLTDMCAKKPSVEHEKIMPAMVDTSSKFLASPPREAGKSSTALADEAKMRDEAKMKDAAMMRDSAKMSDAANVRDAATMRDEAKMKGASGARRSTHDSSTQAAAPKLGHGRGGGGLSAREQASETDMDRSAALRILQTALRGRGGEIFYRQPNTELTHAQAADWLDEKPEAEVDKSVKESADTSRLQHKFERQLGNLVSKQTPPDMQDVMEDVLIESSRHLSEKFVANNYKALVREALIAEMQKRGNEILIELDGAAETFFFAAQRLKKASSLDVKEPCKQVAHYLAKKLEDMIRCRSIARKLTAFMKDHIKDAANYLSDRVTKPDEEIEAYVSLLGEMEAAGDSLLIEGDIPKSYKDAAAYLRQLITWEDTIRRSNGALQTATETKLKNLMANVPHSGYTPAVRDKVIADCTRLLVSYITLQGEKTEALKTLVSHMEEAGDLVLLRHGTIRKSHADGADKLRGLNADQLTSTTLNPDPVASRKIQIKLDKLMSGKTPDNLRAIMDDVIEDATIYLAVHLLQPHVIKVCKCMKNEFVQCELWCDEILRRVAHPCCSCSRHLAAPSVGLSPGSSRAARPNYEIKQCPSKPSRGSHGMQMPCPAKEPICETTSYLLYSAMYNRYWHDPDSVPPHSPPDSLHTPGPRSPMSDTQPFYPSEFVDQSLQMPPGSEPLRESSMADKSNSSPSYHTPPCSSERPYETDHWQTPTAMFVEVGAQYEGLQTRPEIGPSSKSTDTGESDIGKRAPVVSTDEMSDWRAMMVSQMWNVQAWRDWIQENIDRALRCRASTDVPVETEESWSSFRRRVATEALQWRQYNIFSRQLTLRLALRYRDKQIVSPTRATDKTKEYLDCQADMLEIIDMFNRWTKWLSILVKETDSLKLDTESDIPLYELRWNHFRRKVEECSEDWTKYNVHLKMCWEQKNKSLLSYWLPSREHRGPVWVVSACGAVPSGAVAAGVVDGSVAWVARSTHRGAAYPAALLPARHCCVLYADGATHRYTKYQVLCNASVSWVAWRAGSLGVRAVRVAAGVHVGRVLYHGSHLLGAVLAPLNRCHVVIFGRPFAFNCYELLVLTTPDAP